MADTTVECKRCGNTEEIEFGPAMRGSWPYCCYEGMHIKDSSVDMQAELLKIYKYNRKGFSVKR